VTIPTLPKGGGSVSEACRCPVGSPLEALLAGAQYFFIIIQTINGEGIEVGQEALRTTVGNRNAAARMMTWKVVGYR